MIRCPECGSTDVYFEYPFCVWQKSGGGFELDAAQVNEILHNRDNLDERFVCNSCGYWYFSPPRENKNIYEIYVTKCMYGTATVEAGSEEEAESKLDNAEISWHDEEITDITVESAGGKNDTYRDS